MNILWNEVQKNERSRFGQRFLLEPNLSPVSSSKVDPFMFRCEFMIISMQEIHLVVFQSFLLSVHPFPWAMFSSLAGKTSLFRFTLVGIGGVGCCLLWRSQTSNSSVNVVLAKSADHHSHVHSQTRRKAKFEQFASIELDGQYFMTPADFLESLTYRDLPGNDWHMDTHPVTCRSNANLTVPKNLASYTEKWLGISKALCFLTNRVKLVCDWI